MQTPDGLAYGKVVAAKKKPALIRHQLEQLTKSINVNCGAPDRVVRIVFIDPTDHSETGGFDIRIPGSGGRWAT